jgi:LacI family transcriptional regulator
VFALGIVVPQLDNPVFSSAIRGAEMAASALGYSLIISHRDPGRAVDGEYRRLTVGHRVDGLLVASLDEDRGLIGALEETGVPFVLMNRRIGSAPAVALDSHEAARIGVDHLLELGHRRIAHLAGRLEGFNGQARLAGYQAALQSWGLPVDPDLVQPAGYTAEGGKLAVEALLARVRPRPTAILSATVVSAAGALAALHEAGLGIPADISIVAIHDAPIAAMVYPALTTVQTPTESMGARAVELLVALIGGEKPEFPPLLPPIGLIVRRSTAAPSS